MTRAVLIFFSLSVMPCALSIAGTDEADSSFFEHQLNTKATLNARLIETVLDSFLRPVQFAVGVQ